MWKLNGQMLQELQLFGVSMVIARSRAKVFKLRFGDLEGPEKGVF